MLWLKTKERIHRLSYYVCILGMFLLIPLMFVTTGDVILRDFFAKPIPGIVELSEYVLAIFILLGLAYTQQVKGHVGVSFFTSRLSPRSQTICQIITTVASIVITTAIIWQGVITGIAQRTVSDMLRIPQRPFRLLVPIAGILLLIELLIDLMGSIGKLVRRGK